MKFLKSSFFVLWLLPIIILPAKATEEIAQRIDAFRKALLDPTEAALKDLTASQLSYGHSSGVIENQSEFIQKLVSGKSDFVSIDLQNQTINVINDVAIVRHTLVADINDSGNANSIKIGVMLIWQKQSGVWKLIARQAFKFPEAVK